MDAKDVLYRIKQIEKIQNDKDLADLLEINYNTLRGWLQRNSLQFEPIIEYAKKNNIDLNYIFGTKNTQSIENIESPSIIALNNAIAISQNETEVADYLKQFTLQKLFLKLSTTKESFFEKLADIIFPKTQRIILFLYKILVHIAKDDTANNSNDKEYLIEKINSFDLLSFENLGHGFTVFDKKKLISIVENLSDNEISLVLENASKSINILKENLDFLNKLTY
ncbi:MAG: helix-turn-helix domain-containing protein [Bacilli bacterium]|jgi:hypothetical protein|uniref:helix-turn-helix domain-containing protein n=1 Tax=Sulfurimonas sp. TaxID=2022749 RepID=UPI0025E72967|nr:helix-turn-helix domain-containing protein [Sulfurimonas sp.]MCK9454831.1 helix-turn-helix domain containing protein [Sulfurimonas sp.]